MSDRDDKAQKRGVDDDTAFRSRVPADLAQKFTLIRVAQKKSKRQAFIEAIEAWVARNMDSGIRGIQDTLVSKRDRDEN